MKVIKTSILFIFGCLLLYLIIFSRIYLYLFGKKPISFEHIIFFYLSILWTILLLLLSIGAIILLLNKIIFKKNNKLMNLLLKSSHVYTSFINNAFYQSYDSIITFLEKLGFEKLGIYIWKFLENSSMLLINLKPYYLSLNILFLKLPVIIFSLSLFLDICIFQKSLFFISTIPIMLVYFLFKGWISILDNFGKENIDILNKLIDYKVTSENDELFFHFIGIKKNLIVVEAPTPERCKELFLLCLFVRRAYTELTEITKSKLFDYISLVIVIQYFFVLITILYNTSL